MLILATVTVYIHNLTLKPSLSANMKLGTWVYVFQFRLHEYRDVSPIAYLQLWGSTCQAQLHQARCCSARLQMC